jgi:type I restriction enzyme S subunit
MMGSRYTTARLGDLCEVVRGSSPRPKGDPRYFGGSIPWVLISDVTRANARLLTKTVEKVTEAGKECSRYVEAGQLIVSNSATIGLPIFMGMGGCIHDGFLTFLNMDKSLTKDWLYWYFLFARTRLELLAPEGTQKNLNIEIVENIQVPVPPLAEQQRMVRYLEQADRLRRTRRYALELSDTFLPAAFLQLFGDLKSCDGRWAIAPLGEHLESIEGGVNFKPVGENEPASDWRVLKVSAVSWGEFLSEESKPISPSEQFDEKLIVRVGDLIMSRANTVELVGAVACVRTPPPKVLLPDKLWRLKFAANTRLLPDYVLFALRCGTVRREIEIRASGTSGSMKNISQEDAAALLLPVPPLPLQQQFAKLVTRHERLRTVQRESLRQAEHLFQSLLHRAFSGGLCHS